MSEKDSAQSVIDSYRKRQNMAKNVPVIFGAAAFLLVIGAAVIIFWLANPNRPSISLFASPTPTVTETSLPTSTATATTEPSATPTVQATNTLTPTLTPTPASAFVYVVQSGDTLYTIAQTYKVDIQAILQLNPAIDPVKQAIFINQEVIIPAPGTPLQTSTPIPPGFKGTINYTVKAGDSLYSIAAQFNSTVEAMMAANTGVLKNANDLQAGQIIKVPVNIATPVPTRTPNLTTTALPHLPTSTPKP